MVTIKEVMFSDNIYTVKIGLYTVTAQTITDGIFKFMPCIRQKGGI